MIPLIYYLYIKTEPVYTIEVKSVVIFNTCVVICVNFEYIEVMNIGFFYYIFR